MNLKDMPVRYLTLEILDIVDINTSALTQEQLKKIENILLAIYEAGEESNVQENL